MDKYMQNLVIPEYITNISIDVGLSYNAPHSQLWLEHDRNLFVIGFEPNIESVQNILAGNIQKRNPGHGTPIINANLNRFYIVPVALDNVTEATQTTFYTNLNDCGTSSLYKPQDPSLGPVKYTSIVPVYSLKHFFDLFPWERFEYINYIKIDAQGSDLNILKGAGDYLKERIVYITAEPESNQYENCGHNTTAKITEYLQSQNFIPIKHTNTCDPTFINKKFLHLQNIYIAQIG